MIPVTRQRQTGFTLIELMIVIAIMGILATVAIPAYETYADRSRFTEVILAAAAYKSPTEVAVQSGRATTTGQLNAGQLGIPGAVASGTSVGKYVDTIDMAGGVITATSTNLAVAPATYTLTATITNNGVFWSASGSCMTVGLC
jgi:type IV pilus assembly protein PilA